MDEHPKTTGDRTEAHVLAALVETYATVLVPWGEQQRYDFVVEDHAGEFLRIQAKTGRLRDGAVRFNTCSSTAHHRRGGGGSGTSLDYRGAADCFAVHCAATGAVYLVPVHEVGTREASLRVEPARNGQRAGIRFAADYQLHPPG